MTEEEVVDQDTSNPDEEQQPNAEEESKDEPDELAKAKEVGDNQKIRAEKAEAKLKKAEAELAKKVETKTPKKEEDKEQSNEPDYAKLAFLEGKGVKHPDDQKIVQDEADRLKLPLTDILGMEYIKAKLKDSKSQREAEGGMPDDSGKVSSKSKGSVDHWVGKKNKDGTYDTPTDLKLANEVIDARLKAEEGGNKFSDTLYTG